MTIELHQRRSARRAELGPALRSIPRPWASTRMRDRLCLVQLSAGDGDCHLVQIATPPRASASPRPNLKRLLSDPQRPEAVPFRPLRHRACCKPSSRRRWRSRSTAPRSPPGWCAPSPTATASRICAGNCWASNCPSSSRARTGGAETLTQEQLKYAAADVLHLHRAEGQAGRDAGARGPHASWRRPASASCPTRAALDLAGWAEDDIFAH